MLNFTQKLIITTNDSSSGCLKAARLADRVVNVVLQNLCVGPVPLARDPVTCLSDRAALHADPYIDWAVSYVADLWREADAACRIYDQVHIWPEPDANAQLHMLCLLDRLHQYPTMAEKLWINHVETRIGGLPVEEVRNRVWTLIPVEPETLALASAAWNAFRQPTPEAWFGLLERDLTALPYLEKTVLRLLAELPAADSGLSASERTILSMIAEGPVPARAIFRAEYERYPDLVLQGQDLGWTLDRLVGGEHPLIDGLAGGPYTSDDLDHRTYMTSELTLTALGRAILLGEEEPEIDRWWGGTHLTNDSPWRWDEANRALLANPAQPS